MLNPFLLQISAVYAICSTVPAYIDLCHRGTSARTRWYRKGITIYFDIAEEDFDIVGEHQSEWE